MWAVIPVAGQGSRLAGVTAGAPKCLVDVGGKPLLHHLLDQLSRICRGLCLVLPPKNETIRQALEGHPLGRDARCVIQEAPNGLSDAVSRAAAVVEGRALVVMGDTFFGAPLEPAFARLEPQEAALLVDPLAVDPGEPAGWVEPDGQGFAQGVTKGPRPSTSWIRIAGGFVLDAVTLRGLADRGAGVQFETVIDASIKAGTRYRLLEFDGPRWNVNTPEQLAQLRRWHARGEGPIQTDALGAGHGG